MFGILDVSVSGLVAQRTRMEVISSNLANKDSVVRDAQGNYTPFRRRLAVFAPGDPVSGNAAGVHIQEIAFDQSAFAKKYDPGNPMADKAGYVSLSNVDPAFEMSDALDAREAYEANITAAEASKAMLQSSLRLLA